MPYLFHPNLSPVTHFQLDFSSVRSFITFSPHPSPLLPCPLRTFPALGFPVFALLPSTHLVVLIPSLANSLTPHMFSLVLPILAWLKSGSVPSPLSLPPKDPWWRRCWFPLSSPLTFLGWDVKGHLSLGLGDRSAGHPLSSWSPSTLLTKDWLGAYSSWWRSPSQPGVFWRLTPNLALQFLNFPKLSRLIIYSHLLPGVHLQLCYH